MPSVAAKQPLSPNARYAVPGVAALCIRAGHRQLRTFLVALVALLIAPVAGAYQAEQHQALTFIAARAFNNCVAGTGIPTVSPLQVRYIARANKAVAAGGFWRRLVRWQYYDRERQSDKSLLWAVETRMHSHFNRAARNIDQGDGLSETAENLGVVVAYLQDVSVPAIVVPVFTQRFWRFNTTDRFSVFPINEEAVARRAAASCAELLAPQAGLTYQDLLRNGATNTLNSIRSSIPGMDVTWNAFWRESREGEFGEFGEAGNNFGRAVEFSCGFSSCYLLDNDPIYADFAGARHTAAVFATMRALLLAQLQLLPAAQQEPWLGAPADVDSADAAPADAAGSAARKLSATPAEQSESWAD